MGRKRQISSVILSIVLVLAMCLGGMMSVYADDTVGPKLIDYEIAVDNTTPKTEAGSEVIVTLKFDETLQTTSYTKNAFNISINGTTMDAMGFYLDNVTASGSNLILDMKGKSSGNPADDWTYIVTGTLDISLKSNYYEDIQDASGNSCSDWTDINTMIQTGLDFTKTGYVAGDSLLGVKESVTFDSTGDAKLRGMSPIQVLASGDINDPTILATESIGGTTYGGQCNLGRSTVNVHTHMYLSGTNTTWATAFARNFYSQDYTMTASGSAVTLMANTASDTQTLNNATIKMFGYEGPNDRMVQQTLLKNEIAAAQDRASAISASKVSPSRIAALNTAIATANADYAGISNSTTAIEFQKMRAALKAAVSGAQDNEITTTEFTRSSGKVQLALVGGPEWISSISSVSIDDTELDSSAYTATTGALTIKSTSFSYPEREKDYTIKIKAPSYTDVSQTVKVKFYGARTFQLRYVDGSGNIIKAKSYTLDEIKALSGSTDYYFNTACSMTGLRTFKARGAKLTALLADADIPFSAGMTEKLRTNDSVTGSYNDPTDENAYYERSTRTYESLMQSRYFFPDLFNPTSALATTVTAQRGMNDTVRAALGASTTKVETEPLIAYEYVEKVYSSDQSSLTGDSYDENLAADKCFRFLFGTAMDSSSGTEVAATEVTTWSVAYQTFGVDIINPSYSTSTITFDNAIEGTDVIVKDDYGTVVTPESDGSYTLENGRTYTYVIAKDGYTAKTGSVDVSGNQSIDAALTSASSSGSSGSSTRPGTISSGGGGSSSGGSGGGSETTGSGIDTSVPDNNGTGTDNNISNGNTENTGSGNTLELNYNTNTAYVSGYEDGTIKPDKNITRAETAQMVYRLITDASKNTVSSASGALSDVSSNAWYAGAVNTLLNAGVISGYKDNSFRGDNNITRAEFASIVAKLIKLDSAGGTSKFTDTNGHWAEKYISNMADKGYITGYSDGTFKPDEYITRAEAMAIMNRVLGRAEVTSLGSQANTWTDNQDTSKWYFGIIQAATNAQ